MSKLEVDAIEPQSGTTITIGSSGDTVNLVGTLQSNGSPLPGDISEVIAGTGLSGGGTTGAVTINIDSAQPTITSLGTITGFSSTGIDDNATSTAITIDSSERVGIGYSSTLNGNLNVDGNVGLGNFISASNPTGGTYNLTDPDGSNINQIVRIGEDDDSGNAVADLQLVSYGSNDNFGGGNLRFVNSRYSNDVALIKGSRESATTGYLAFYTESSGLKERMHIHDNGDISFYEDTGTTPKMFWDASTERLGIGTSSPSTALHIDANVPNIRLTDDAVSTSANARIDLYGSDNRSGYVGMLSGNLEIWHQQAKNIRFATSNTERMRIDSSGKVGIGTTSPSAKLHVDVSDSGVTPSANADDLFVESSGSTGITIGSGTGNFGRINFGDSGDANIGIIQYEHTTNAFAFTTNASERMRITNAGNVGIGTSSPSTNLQIEANDNLTTTFPVKITNSAGSGFTELGCYAINTSAVDLVLQAGGNEGLRIDKDNGNVGIGTSSPGTKLEVVGTGVNGIELGQQSDGNDSSRLFFTNNSNVCAIRSSGGSLKFSTGATINSSSGDDRVTINSSGNVGIGTTSTNARLSVADTKTGTEASPHLLIVGNGYSGHHWLDTSAYYIGQNSNARSLRIYSGSNEAAGAQLGAGGNSFGTYSDERLKKDITDLTNGLNKILALRPVNFKYKSDADDYRNRIGIIAQSIVGQVDEALDETKITADDETKYYNVRYQDLIPVLVKGIQEQQTQIQELEARITTLENA